MRLNIENIELGITRSVVYSMCPVAVSRLRVWAVERELALFGRRGWFRTCSLSSPLLLPLLVILLSLLHNHTLLLRVL